MNKIFQGKKAMSPIVNRLIIFALVTLILLGLYSGIASFLNALGDREACRISVYAKYGGKIATFGTSETSINLQCSTQKIRITKDGIYKKGSKGKEKLAADFKTNKLLGAAIFGSNSRPDNKLERNDKKVELVKRVIANEMRDCWDQFGLGKLSVFTDGKRCVICSEIEFETDWLDVSGLEVFPGEMAKKDYIMGFGEFLNTESADMRGKQTYAQFYGEQFDPSMFINTKQKTNIIFRAVARSWWNDFKDVALGGCVASLVTGALMLIPGGPLIAIAAIAVGTGTGLAVSGDLDTLYIGPTGVASGMVVKPIATAAGKKVVTTVVGKSVGSIGGKAMGNVAGKIAGNVAGKVIGAAAIPGVGCLVSIVVGAATADDLWIPSLVIGPESLVSSSCDRLY